MCYCDRDDNGCLDDIARSCLIGDVDSWRCNVYFPCARLRDNKTNHQVQLVEANDKFRYESHIIFAFFANSHPPALSTVAMITSRCQRGGGAAIRSSWMMILVVLFACEGIAFSRPALPVHQQLTAPSPLSSTRRTTKSTAGRWPAPSSTVRIDRHNAVDPRRATTTTARTSSPTTSTSRTTRHRPSSSSAMALQSLRGGGGGIIVANFSRMVRYIGQKRSRCLMILAAAILLESCATGLSKRAKDTGSVATFLVAASLNIMWYVAVSLLLVSASDALHARQSRLQPHGVMMRGWPAPPIVQSTRTLTTMVLPPSCFCTTSTPPPQHDRFQYEPSQDQRVGRLRALERFWYLFCHGRRHCLFPRSYRPGQVLVHCHDRGRCHGLEHALVKRIIFLEGREIAAGAAIGPGAFLVHYQCHC
jgi:hypothetical protein